MSGAYQGLRVVDFSHVVAGPFCTRLLADHGAEVVKVESYAGDVMRRLPATYGGDLSSAFAQYNAGKRSVAVDLKSDEGRGIARGLCDWADVVVENFAVGAMERLGLGYDTLRESNPDVILCSISSFGNTGPYRDIPGYGLVAEAYSGLMMLAADEGQMPTHFGTPLADMTAGTHAFGAIGAALYRRATTGEGTHIDISCFDALVSMIDEALTLETFTRGEMKFGRYGTYHPTSVPSAIVKVGNGEYVTYGSVGDVFFRRLCTAIGNPALADDERFSSSEARARNHRELYPIIAEWASHLPDAASMVEAFAEHGIPAARVRSHRDLLNDPHLIARGTLAPLHVEEIGDVLIQTAPHPMSGAEVLPRSAPPHLGEHTCEVLRGVLSLDAAQVDRLVAGDVVRTWSKEA
jgi:crotonobetainyl-CoA:carnitine CoA-transferase CaiB-like acyl-CoA transferase